MGAPEIVGYLLALIDLFDRTSKIDGWLLSFRAWLVRVAKRFPLKALIPAYLGFGAVFSFYVRNNAAAHDVLGGGDVSNPLALVIMLVLALPIYFIILLALVHLLQFVFGIFARHPKGILGSFGLALTVTPDIWRLGTAIW